MKYLVLMAVLAIAWGVWRKQRRPSPPGQPPAAAPTTASPQDMVACAHCGLHIPRTEALGTDQKPYCCADHQRRGEA
ncbi:MAG: PP0621 family protein [Burkholderiaceae bacterium]|nr:PP0621 family protein [Burkholderiaceae bacterium]